MSLEDKIKNITYNLSNREFNKVIKDCEKIIKLKIENTIIYNLYGLSYQKQGYYDKSIKAFEKSIKLDKKNFLAFNNLAISLKAIKKINLANKAYQDCLKIKSDYPIGIINYANLKQEMNRADEAINLYLKVLKIKTEVDDVYIFSKLSKLYQSIGDFEKGKIYANKILEKQPKNISAHILFSEFSDFKKDKNQLNKLEKFFDNKNLSINEKIDLAFTLGKAHEGSKKFEKAYKFFSQGNALKQQQVHFDISDFKKLQSSIIKFFKNFDYKNIKKNPSDKKIIFICGMPRSGTTLIEQIISSHSEVLPTGENNFLSMFIKENYLKNFSLIEEKISKNIYSKKNLFSEYIYNLFDEYNFVSGVYTDKSVQNFLWIGFIKIFFPNSKIIITDRNKRDVCLSLFKTNFTNGFMNFAYNQKEIAEFYNLYLEIINFWKETLSDDIYIANYEKLIENPEFEIIKLINFCDLRWDTNCLYHDKNKSVINTASINQARKPIYKSSKNLNVNYEKYLQEMFNLIKN